MRPMRELMTKQRGTRKRVYRYPAKGSQKADWTDRDAGTPARACACWRTPGL